MKKAFLGALLSVFLVELSLLVYFTTSKISYEQNTIAVNEVLQTVIREFENIESHEQITDLDYVVIDLDENVLFRSMDGLSESINEAIRHRDTILDIEVAGTLCGKLIIMNDGADILNSRVRTVTIIMIVSLFSQAAICTGYYLYLDSIILKPFKKARKFARRVAEGNLDIPLEMDKKNILGAFTESFDLMRTELKKARLSEARAQQSKKELVAKLSHDIKTPAASIIAVTEVGEMVAESENDKNRYQQINLKANQITTLVNNLFTATLNELQQLDVLPIEITSEEVYKMLNNADYLHRAEIPPIEACLVIADPLRLQQVFDNIFANSYKYADSKIEISISYAENCLLIAIEDYGKGLLEEDISLIKEKYRRGANSTGIEGAGLGLFISDYFMKEMIGDLTVENGNHGLKVTVSIALC